MNNPNDSKVALLGATGKAGSVILRELLDRGFAVRALVRDPRKAMPAVAGGLETLAGDARDEAAIRGLIEGCGAIVNAASNAGNPEPISESVTRMILGLLEDRPSVRYLVITGRTVAARGDRPSWAAFKQRGYVHRLYPAIARSKQAEYARLRSSGASWTLVRCPLMVDGGGRAYAAEDRACRGNAVTKEALARFLADELEKGEWLRRSPFVYSPQVAPRRHWPPLNAFALRRR